MAHPFLTNAVYSAIELVRLLRQRLRIALLTLVSPSSVLCALYYTFLSGAFRREQRAVVCGMLRQARSLDEDALMFRLRRNIHRLEKGLMMKPRRPVFALSYISGAVECYERLLARGVSHAGQELEWAGDVLTSFFGVVSAHPVIDRARARFEALKQAAVPAPSRIPYQREAAAPVCDYKSFLQLSIRRRSVRWFEKKTVPRELLDQALQAALQAPSSCNRQPFVFRFFDESQKVQAVAALPMGTSGFAENIPVICAVCGDLTAYAGERDRHGIYVDASLAAMSFMLALETLGLSSVALNWPDMKLREERMAKLLNLRPEQRVIMLLALGYADPECPIAYSQKKSLDQIRTFNE